MYCIVAQLKDDVPPNSHHTGHLAGQRLYILHYAVASMALVTDAKLWSSSRNASSTSVLPIFMAGERRMTLLYIPPLPISSPCSRAASISSFANSEAGSLVTG